MLIIPCPYCGPRAEVEFRHAGEAHRMRPADPDALSDAEWAEYLYFRANTQGRHFERWRHFHGCGRFFNVVRDTQSDRIEAAYPAGSTPPPESQP